MLFPYGKKVLFFYLNYCGIMHNRRTVNNSQKNDGTSDNVSNVVNSEYNYNLTKRTTTQAVKESTYKMKVTVDTEGNVYLDCNDSVINDVEALIATL